MKTTLVWRNILSAACLFAAVSAVRAEEKPKSDVPPGLLKKFDKNNDGVLDADEKAAFEKERAVRQEKEKARRSEMLAKFDTNKDGKLSDGERATAKIEMEKTRSEMEGERKKAKEEKKDARERGEKKPKNEP
ncbi:MAG: hypothetical protein NTU80_14420 [Verrucomicrobia bacterium]|nr:hypothetical protein [Verrucomicrobiota bacterium]